MMKMWLYKIPLFVQNDLRKLNVIQKIFKKQVVTNNYVLASRWFLTIDLVPILLIYLLGLCQTPRYQEISNYFNYDFISAQFLGSWCENSTSDAVLRARASVAFHKENYKQLYSILENSSFDSKYHGQLQDIWWKAHYTEAENMRGRPLCK